MPERAWARRLVSTSLVTTPALAALTEWEYGPTSYPPTRVHCSFTVRIPVSVQPHSLTAPGTVHLSRTVSTILVHGTHIAGVGTGGLIFVNAKTGEGATARLDRAGNYASVGRISGFGAWTHIVGM